MLQLRESGFIQDRDHPTIGLDFFRGKQLSVAAAELFRKLL
ncbi:hypothetical protein [Marinobacter iranensis]|nr:hypothetical protein [Marinobacter iranensis]